MAKAATKTELAPSEPDKNLPSPLISDDLDLFAGMPSGLENVTARDISIPRLTILQGLSPQVTRGNPEYDDEARVGDIYDTSISERFPNGIEFLPVHFVKQWLEWLPRDTRVKMPPIVHETDAILSKCERDDRGKMVLPNGNVIEETAMFYGLNVGADFRRSFLPMASSQLKSAKRLLDLATTERASRSDGTRFTPPLYYRVYELTTVPRTNSKGSWMGWKVERFPKIIEDADGEKIEVSKSITDYPNWKELLLDVKDFREAVVAGTVKGDLGNMDNEAGRTTIDHDDQPF